MEKRRKKRKIKVGRIIILVLILSLIIIALFNISNIKTLFNNNYGYSNDVVAIFKENNIYDYVIDKKKYSKTLEVAITSNKFDKKYLDEYLNVNYVEDNDFIDNVNTLLNIGYDSKEINTIYENVKDSVDIITNKKYNKELVNYFKLDYFNEDNLERYMDYENDKNIFDSVYDTSSLIDEYNYEDTVTFVNANLDKEYYTNDINLSNEEAEKLDVIVNKYYKLDKNYVPSDLELISSKFSANNQKMRSVAKEAFEDMCEKALNENIKIYAGSTYRSYDYQLGLYNRYVLKDGFSGAETYSARAGYSEHQLGLAVDILNGKWDYVSEDDKEYEWLINNSYNYGFILRYPRGSEYITGYMFEDWHFRYLGIELATKVYNSGLTYDEYVARGL